MTIYLPLARLTLWLGHPQLSAMLARTWFELWLLGRTQQGEKQWQTLGRLTRNGVIDRPTRNRVKAAYDHLSRSIHGRNVQASTLKRCLSTVSILKGISND